jgi:dTDP-glucose 4,6-dehydratase
MEALRFTPSCVLVTGGAGFIGSNFIRWLLEEHPDISVVNLDLLTYAGNLESLEDVSERFGVGGDGRYYFVRGDIRDHELVTHLVRGEGSETAARGAAQRTPPAADAIVHTAAESHVDRSIMGPGIFVDTNVKGTLALLEACRAELEREARPFRFLHVSTDEVYGSLELNDPAFTETTRLAPNSPYSASKAGSDLLVRAYVETFELPAVTTRCSNNYGPYQFPEKLIPLMITRALRDESLPVFGDGLNVRDWLHVLDHARALWATLLKGQIGEIYNIGGESEVRNIDIVKTILRLLAKPDSLIHYVSDRRGHDRRYAMNISKISDELGWTPQQELDAGLAATVEWYLSNQSWWERVLNEAYLATGALYLTEA